MSFSVYPNIMETQHKQYAALRGEPKKMFRCEMQNWEIVKTLPPEKAKAALLAKKLNPSRYYCPTGAQEEVINCIGNSCKTSNIPIILDLNGNREGKSTKSAHIKKNVINGPQNGWFESELFQRFPFPKRGLTVSTAEALKNTIIPAFESLFDPKDYVKYHEGKTWYSKFEFRNGWTWQFKTYDQPRVYFESQSFGFVDLDEPCPKIIFDAIKSRRDEGCIMYLPMTPLDAQPYVFDEIIRKVDDGENGYHKFNGSIYSTTIEEGIRGWRFKKDVDAFVAAMDPEEREARAFGKPIFFAGLVFPTFNRVKHVIPKGSFKHPKGTKYIMGIDPHDARYPAVTWWAVHPNGRMICVAEYPTDHSCQYWEMKGTKSFDEYVRDWIEIEYRNGITNPTRVIDRHFGFQTRSGSTLAYEYMMAGKRNGANIVFLPSYSSQDTQGEVAYGNSRIRTSLEDMEDGIPATLFEDHCFHMISGMEHFCYRQCIVNGVREYGKLSDRYKDMCDSYRFARCHTLSKPDEYEPVMMRFNNQLTSDPILGVL